MARSRAAVPAIESESEEVEIDGRPMYRVTKDGVDLDNGIEVGHPASGARRVILSIALQSSAVTRSRSRSAFPTP